MTLSPEATQVLYADATGQSLEAQLQAAYSRNLELGTATAQNSLSAIAAAAVANAKATAPETSSLPDIDPTFRSLAERVHGTTTELYDRIGLATPNLAEFAEAGIDFAKLATAHNTMTRLGLEPELVLAPVLEQEQWADLFQALQDDSTVNHDDRIKQGGLWVNDDVAANWDKLNEAGAKHSIDISTVRWQVVVLPGTNRPPVTSLDHNGADSNRAVPPELMAHSAELIPDPKDRTVQNLHPTIATYLTTQALRLQAGESPIDSNTWTWLDGEFGPTDSLRAPLGYWSPDGGQVGLDWSGVGSRIGGLGVRLPVWGEA